MVFIEKSGHSHQQENSLVKEQYKEKGGALIIYSPERFAYWLLQGNVGVTPFGPDMFAVVAPLSALEDLAQVKGRAENKANVQVTSRNHINKLLSVPGISPEVTAVTKELAGNILYHGSQAHPIGIILLRDTETPLHKRLQGTLQIEGATIPTISFMVAGPDQEFEAIIEYLSTLDHILAGTSANLSRIGKKPETRARGSGHHRLAGAVIDFGWNSKVGIYVPQKLERKGPSTTTIYLNPTGSKAYLVREGSLNWHETQEFLRRFGIKEFGEVTPSAQKIDPYDYPKTFTDLLRDKGYRHAPFIHTIVEKLIYKRDYGNDFRIPSYLRVLLPRPH